MTASAARKIDLTQYEEAFQKAEVKEKGEFTPLPNGIYQARVERAAIEPTNSGDKLKMTYEMVITSGKYMDRHVWKNTVIGENTLGIIKTDASRLGVPTNSLHQLQDSLDQMLDKVVEIRIKNSVYKGEPIQNVYINKLVHTPGNTTQTASSQPAMQSIDEEMPF